MSENFWPAEQSALVRGVAHALSNRVGTLVAVAGMLSPGEAVSAMVVDVVRDETERLEGLLSLVRLLGEDAGAPEPIHLPDVVTPVVELHSHHPVFRDIPVSVTPDPLAPPVRARHAGLVRALLVLLSAAKAGGTAAIAWRAEGPRVVLAVRGVSCEAAVAAAASALLGGEVRATAEGYEARLPGL
jgi:nitrogen-specific signal transduction histidine kinase